MIRKNQEENQGGIWDFNRWVCCLEKKHIKKNIKGIQNNNNWKWKWGLRFRKQEGKHNWVHNTLDHKENIYLNTFIYS